MNKNILKTTAHTIASIVRRDMSRFEWLTIHVACYERKRLNAFFVADTRPGPVHACQVPHCSSTARFEQVSDLVRAICHINIRVSFPSMRLTITVNLSYDP